MAELFETLEKTGALLSSAVDQYLDACVAVSSYPRLSFAGVSRAFFDRIASELAPVTSYETKIKQAKATIGYIINSSSPVSHVNSLPSEILIRIFYMVTDTCGLMYDVGNSISLPRYPDFLSHVCTRWRQVALDSPCLWTHIDVVRLSAPNRGFKPRAETFVLRAGSCLLDVHIYQQTGCYNYDHQSMLDLITLTAPQTRSLELVAGCIPGYGHDLRLLEYCLNNYVPKTFTTLNLIGLSDPNDDSTQSIYFIDSHDRFSQVTRPGPLNISADHLDALLLPVTHLKLDGVYFPWTHQAYHGLVELHLLVNGESGPHITRIELEGILAASPRLKRLHSEVNLADDPPVGSFIAPVSLDDLEVLELHSLDDENPHLMLSILLAGPKPLRFSFTHNQHSSMTDPQEEWLIQIKEFFKRSNIAELRLRHAAWPPDVGPENILESLPTLRILVLERCDDDPRYFSSPFPPPDPNLPRIDVMYMIECTINLDKLARTFKHLRAELVVFWGCSFRNDGEVAQRRDEEAIRAELGAICPSLTWVDGDEPNPIDHWD